MFPQNLKFAVASTPNGGVVVAQSGNEIVLWFVSSGLAGWDRRKAYETAVKRAVSKLLA